MPERSASRTAEGVAVIRAAHQLLDAPPPLVDDPIAPALLTPGGTDVLRTAPERFRTLGALRLRSHILLRSRYAEDRLAAAVARGVRQYVQLGAGFETFAYRQPSWAAPLRIFEVDHPATQSVKRARLADAGIVVPPNVSFAPIDFEAEGLEAGLARHGVRLDEPLFCSWLGVTMYLTADAVHAVLASMARRAPSSEIVFTFATPLAEGESQISVAAAAVGEPWQTFFEPDALAGMLRELGFTQVTLLDPAEAETRYFKGRTDLPPPRRTTIVSAIV